MSSSRTTDQPTPAWARNRRDGLRSQRYTIIFYPGHHHCAMLANGVSLLHQVDFFIIITLVPHVHMSVTDGLQIGTTIVVGTRSQAHPSTMYQVIMRLGSVTTLPRILRNHILPTMFTNPIPLAAILLCFRRSHGRIWQSMIVTRLASGPTDATTVDIINIVSTESRSSWAPLT